MIPDAPEKTLLSQVNRILIIRPSALGDIVMASPLLRALRNAWPEAYIAWLVEPPAAELLRHHPDLDEIILWRKSEWRKLSRNRQYPALLREVRSLATELRTRRFDLALDAVGLLKSRFLARLSGARRRIGFASREPGAFLMTDIISRGPEKRTMSSEYRYMAQALGVDPGDFHPCLTLAAEDETAARQIRQARKLERYAVFAPFTTRAQKHWFEERWAELTSRVQSRFGLTPVLLGGPGDKDAALRITEAGGGSENLVGVTSIGETAALIRSCSLLVGVDTGLTHMGTAFSRPTLALFGATCPYLETPSPHTRVLYDPLPCSPCKRSPSCQGEFSCMRALTVDRVMQAAEELLKAAA